MFHSICKTLLHSRNCYIVTAYHNPSMVVPLILRYFSSDADNPHSFTLSYLTKTCGLSPKSALSASKIVQFESSEQPDSVLSCFQKFGFSKIQISEMIRKFPKVLCCYPEKTISPKLEFFLSRGASTPELVKMFTSNPWILSRSLENQLIRTYNILIGLFQSEDKAIEVFKRNPRVRCNSPEALIPNINTLRENGVPESNILWLFRKHWLCIEAIPIKFQKIVEEVKEMGFSPLKLQFVEAIMILTVVSKSKRDGKVEVYKRWGWSDKDVTNAFKKYPRCMAYSEDNIRATMDFYVNKMGLESSVIMNSPVLLGLSLKKRLIPRGAVIQFLSSKGLVKSDSSITTLFMCPEMRFLEKYVNCHEEAPHLITLYNILVYCRALFGCSLKKRII
ncbi:transcription termination factor MTERF6, chloroplastic/mitochondrial-like [Euphorbia lathyris]|uniref:transcription termination factor MTERF6, chloroplastic/mitochondrial-like n=1 Tax=Euphorbia lathyris TaxID=212925 RepID=UPI003313FB05